jgi:hypothetical protein
LPAILLHDVGWKRIPEELLLLDRAALKQMIR